MAPTTTPARERILDAAQYLVLRHGFAATTVDAVLSRAGASKGAFFHHFPSKAHLGRALVERYAAADAALLEDRLAAAAAVTDDPAEQLVELTRSFELSAEEAVHQQPSCLFVSFIYETELVDATTERLVVESIEHWRNRLLELLERAAEQRPGLRQVDLASLADHWFTTFEGAFLLAQALDDPACMGAQLAHLRHYLELLLAVE